jgi:hypothetical protein
MKRHALPQAGFDVLSWCVAVGVGRTTFYTLPSDQKPRSALIGTRRIVCETPSEYLARMALLQANKGSPE